MHEAPGYQACSFAVASTCRCINGKPLCRCNIDFAAEKSRSLIFEAAKFKMSFAKGAHAVTRWQQQTCVCTDRHSQSSASLGMWQLFAANDECVLSAKPLTGSEVTVDSWDLQRDLATVKPIIENAVYDQLSKLKRFSMFERFPPFFSTRIAVLDRQTYASLWCF